MPNKSVRGVPLSASQYSELLRIRGEERFNGRNLQDTLRELIAKPEYAQLSDEADPTLEETKADAIKRAVSGDGTAAQLVLLQRDPELRSKVEAERRRQVAPAAALGAA
jgi:hypothetical protein